MKPALAQAYMTTAETFAQLSYAKRRQVGAVIVRDGILSEGYNGTPAGWDNACEDDDGKTLPYVIHAEQNALDKLTRSTTSSVGATLFVTLAPCSECAKRLIGAGIKKVYYRDTYRDMAGVDYLHRAGIEVERI